MQPGAGGMAQRVECLGQAQGPEFNFSVATKQNKQTNKQTNPTTKSSNKMQPGSS
jgi:hypothetical protein